MFGRLGCFLRAKILMEVRGMYKPYFCVAFMLNFGWRFYMQKLEET